MTFFILLIARNKSNGIYLYILGQDSTAVVLDSPADAGGSLSVCCLLEVQGASPPYLPLNDDIIYESTRKSIWLRCLLNYLPKILIVINKVNPASKCHLLLRVEELWVELLLYV